MKATKKKDISGFYDGSCCVKTKLSYQMKDNIVALSIALLFQHSSLLRDTKVLSPVCSQIH